LRWKEREACRGERKAISGGGYALVVHGGFEVVRAEKAMKKERKKKFIEKKGEDDDFSPNFAPDFLLPRAMKPTPIYKGWKRDIFL
jgi:hypothetical protein